MITYIAILRGINVGGNRIIKMDALTKLFSNLGFSNIKTYIQSGNVVFKYTKKNNQLTEKLIANAIKNTFNFDVPVIVFSLDELNTIIKNNPFVLDKTKDVAYLHLTFLAQQPNETNFIKIKDLNFNEDEFTLIDKTIYIYCPNGYGNTKLTNTFFETKLKVSATTRNFKTTHQLQTIALAITNSY